MAWLDLDDLLEEFADRELAVRAVRQAISSGPGFYTRNVPNVLSLVVVLTPMEIPPPVVTDGIAVALRMACIGTDMLLAV